MDNPRLTDDTAPVPVTIGIAAIGPCILWTGRRDRGGYGTRWFNGRDVKAHRHAWTEVHGDPGALKVCHRCDIRNCINVAHLFLGTQADNVADMVAKGRKSRLNGERNGSAKLTADQVRDIRLSTETNQATARLFRVSKSTVTAIRLDKTWAHLPGNPSRQRNRASQAGERNPKAKLTEDQIREIRASTESSAAAASRYGVSKCTVSNIRLRRTWKHLS